MSDNLSTGSSMWEASMSLDSMVLSNPAWLFKKRLFNSIPKVLGEEPSFSVWEYGTGDHHLITQSIYVDSRLRATSEASMKAFAEAFVHPALLSHPNPCTVALISDLPIVLLKEVLKGLSFWSE